MNGSTGDRTAALNSGVLTAPITRTTMSDETGVFYRLAGEWTVVCHPLDDAGVPGPSIGGRTRNISAGGAELAPAGAGRVRARG